MTNVRLVSNLTTSPSCLSYPNADGRWHVDSDNSHIYLLVVIGGSYVVAINFFFFVFSLNFWIVITWFTIFLLFSLCFFRRFFSFSDFCLSFDCFLWFQKFWFDFWVMFCIELFRIVFVLCCFVLSFLYWVVLYCTIYNAPRKYRIVYADSCI